jgi:ribonuclease HII
MGEFHLKKILSKKKIKSNLWSVEKRLIRKHKTLISIDEAGRGALAGPLVLGSLYLDKTSLKILTKNKIVFFDSKILKPEQREIFRKIIKKLGLPYKIVSLSHKIIDKIGINNAFILGVKKIINHFQPGGVLLDGRKLKELNYQNIYFFVKGDQRINSLGGASILAKTHRDSLMKRMSKKYPQYLFEIHKGYGTKKHKMLIKKFGLSLIHRRSFRF